jgi:SAM-dependent methyltransferase
MAGGRGERVPCPLCASDASKPYRKGMYRFEDVPFDLVRCACGLVYVNPRPDAASIARMYDDADYYTHGYNLGVETENYFDRKEELIAQYERTARELAQEIGSAGDLLELGSAGGFFLEGARRAGFRVRGVELSPQAYAYSRRELGLDVFHGQLEEAPFEESSFDVAYADNVLEHTTDPGAVLELLRKLLRPGGHLVVIVPSYVNSAYFRALLALQSMVPRRLLGEQLLGILKLDPRGHSGNPYHILEFDRATLAQLVGRSGFEIVDVEGSVPFPGHLFRDPRPSLKVRALRGVFRTLDRAMRLRLAPGARIRLVARRAPHSGNGDPRPASR